MKLKTEQEIREMAKAYSPKSHHLFTSEDVQLGYEEGYERCYQDLLASASEGFEEWAESVRGEDALNPCFDDWSINEVKEAWQAAKLSSAREIELIKKDHKNEEDCWLITVESKYEKITELQKEIEELKKSVKLQKDINQSEALLNTSLHRERLKLENEIMQLREDLEWALCSYNPRYLGDEEKCKEIIKRHGLDKSEDMASKKEV